MNATLFPRTLSTSVASIIAVVALAHASSAHGAQVWKIDFGSGNPTSSFLGETWNTIPNAVATTDFGQVLDIFDTTGAATNVDFLMLARFGGENGNGTQSSTLPYPVSATRDSLFGNTETFENRTNIFPRFKLTSLDPGLAYDLTFYASRTGVTDNRETLYTVTGASVSSVALNVANNIDNTASLFGVVPNEFGEIEIGLTPGPNNNNGNHFTYLGVLTMAVPEPASALFLVAGTGLVLARRQRRAV